MINKDINRNHHKQKRLKYTFFHTPLVFLGPLEGTLLYLYFATWVRMPNNCQIIVRDTTKKQRIVAFHISYKLGC